MNDAPRVGCGLEDEPSLPLSDAAYAMLELLPSQMTAILHGSEDSLTIGVWGFVTECHRLALSKHVEDFGPDDIVALIRRHPACRWHGLAMLESDVADGWRECLAKAREDLERRMRARELAETLFDPWADPPPPEFPGGVLTREMEDTIFALAMRDGVCPGALAMAYLAAASGAAPKAARFMPYQSGDWSVPPIVWVMTIADSGQRKTAIEDRAFVALREVHAAVWRAHRRRFQEWQALTGEERRTVPKPEEPHSFLVEDVTPEKLQMILAATDRGTFMARDEMAGLFEFGRYAKNTGAAERAFYLQAYEGGHYTVSRVSRDSLHIAVNALTIYGSIQPDRLKDFPDLAKDGLLQRINMVRASPASASRDNVSVQGVDKINAAISALTRHEAQRYRTTPDASNTIRQTERDGRSYATITDCGPGFQGTCSKLHGTHARWALILHLLDNPDSELIPQTTVERAAILIREFLLPQARDFFANLTGSPQQRLRDAAGWILTRAPMRFLASNLTAGVWACRGISTKDLGDLLDPLVTGGWLEPEAPFPGNRAWIINPILRAAFAARAETESARRDEARRLFQELGNPYLRARP
jgi:hypothetical protein